MGNIYITLSASASIISIVNGSIGIISIILGTISSEFECQQGEFFSLTNQLLITGIINLLVLVITLVFTWLKFCCNNIEAHCIHYYICFVINTILPIIVVAAFLNAIDECMDNLVLFVGALIVVIVSGIIWIKQLLIHFAGIAGIAATAIVIT